MSEFFCHVVTFTNENAKNTMQGVTLLLGFATVFVAWRGLTAWKMQMATKVDQELAAGLFRLLVDYRSAARNIRHTYILASEADDAKDDGNTLLATTRLRRERFFKLSRIGDKLRDGLYEAALFWPDSEVGSEAKKLNDFETRIFWKLNRLEEYSRKRFEMKADDPEWDAVWDEHATLSRYLETLIDNEDDFARDLKKAIEGAERLLVEKIRVLPKPIRKTSQI